MTSVCRSKVVPMYGVTPAHVRTEPASRQTDGGYALKGSVDKGAEGVKPFQRMFDRKGRFRNVMSLVDEGAL